MHKQRGFTLLEVVVGSAIGAMVTFGALAMMAGQIEGFNRQERVSGAQMIVRSAMNDVVRRVRDTGFGLPPEWAVGAGSLNNVATAGSEGTCPGTDVLEVRARDPRGYWHLAPGSTSSSLKFTKPSTMATDFPWPLGQRAFVYSSLGKYSLVRTSATRAASVYTIGLVASESTDLAIAGNADVKTSSQVYLVRTTRLRLTCIDPAHPVLVLEEDVDTDPFDNVVNYLDQSPIAGDIEDFQVAYLVDTDQDGLVADTDVFQHYSLATGAGLVTDLDKRRAVKGVRISIVARAQSQANNANKPIVVEDHSPAQTADKYVRRLLRQVVIFDNRDTAEPTTYLHLSNQVL